MADIVSLIPSYISVKDAARALELHPRTASRKIEPIKHQFLLSKSDLIPVRIFCAYFNMPLSTLIRKLYPNLYLELHRSFTIAQLNEMF
jgi:hypothetical protein